MYTQRSKLLLYPLFLILAFGIQSFSKIQAQETDEMATMRVVGQAKQLGGEIIADRDDNRDINGNLTAGLRVVSDLTGLTFTSNNGIHKIQQLPGYNLLYLSANERLVRVFKDGFPPFAIVLNDENISLEAGQVWEIRITGNQKSTTEPVQFTVTPENSSIFIDGEEFTIDGTIFETELSTGDHFIQLRQPRHRFIDDSISVSSERVNSHNYTLEEIDPIRVQINSDPEGASIYLNNKAGSEGNTPRFVNIYPGALKVELRLDGYSTLVDELEYTEDIGDLNYNLEKYEGYLTVNTTPENAILLVDGTRLTSKENVPLTPGVKSIEVRSQGFDPSTDNIEITQGDTLVLDMPLNEITGNLYFTIQQSEATVRMTRNGQLVREWQGFETFRDLPVGTYEIRAEQTNFQTQTRTIEITRNSEETVDLDLSQIDGRGSLSINSLFEDAEVTLQGPGFSRSWDKTPINLPSLPYGSYIIEVDKDGFDDIERQVQVNSLSQEITFVDEFKPRSKGRAIWRSILPGAVIPGLGHGYLGKGGRGFLYFLGGGAAIAWTYKSYTDYNKSYNNYQDALQVYNDLTLENSAEEFTEKRKIYRDYYEDAVDNRKAIETGLTIYAALKGLELFDLLLQRSNKKLLKNAKMEFDAANSGISMSINF